MSVFVQNSKRTAVFILVGISIGTALATLFLLNLKNPGRLEVFSDL